MYPSSSSSSSSSHGSIMRPRGGGLSRYGSAPGSLLTTAVDSVIGPDPKQELSSALGSQTSVVGPTRYFSFSSETSSLKSSESTCNATATDPRPREPNKAVGLQLQRSYGLMNETAIVGESTTTACENLKSRTVLGGSSRSLSLVRHSSSPAGFLNQVTTTATAADNSNGFSVTRGMGSYTSKGASDIVHGISRLNSQLSFTRQDSLSQITEESENVDDGVSADGHRKPTQSYATAGFGMGSWDDTNAIMFSDPARKRAKSITSDIVNGLNIMESQFGLPQTALEMATLEKLLEIPEDSVPCKIRAKRGCATHPRSIAERERRTRISGKLKKLQELVPNMDKGRPINSTLSKTAKFLLTVMEGTRLC